MKKILLKIVLLFFKILHYFINYDTIEKCKYLNSKCYSLWLRFYFKECSNAYFCKPIYIKGAEYIKIGDMFNSGPRFRIEAWDRYGEEVFSPEIVIGKNVSFSSNCHIGSINKILIKDNVLVGSNVFITDHSHGIFSENDLQLTPAQRKLYSKGPVIIEENVWIGENVTVLPGLTIGSNSIVGANSVVTKNVPPNVLAVGNPAVVIKKIN